MNEHKPIATKYIILSLILACGALFYHHPNTPGMFMDGALYSKIAQNAAEHNFWLLPKFENWLDKYFFEHPPFFFIFHGLLMKAFGVSWATARLANAIVAIVLVFSFFFSLKRIKGQNTAFLSTVILFLTLPFLKKMRFPNMDVALTLFTMLSLFSYFKSIETKQLRDWLLTGLFFGLALLMKGHPGLMIPFVIVLHLIFSKRLDILKDLKAWGGFALGFVIFGIWPLSLLAIGKLEGFNLWFTNQFVKTVVESRGAKVETFFYFKFLLKYCTPWFFLSLYSTFLTTKEKKWDQLEGLAALWFWGILIGMSLVGWKLSHYIIPVYPAMAILSIHSLLHFFQKYEPKLVKGFMGLLVAGALIILVLPSGGKIRRYPFIFEIQNKLIENKLERKNWIILNNAEEYFGIASNATFNNSYAVYSLSMQDTLRFIDNHQNNWLVLGRSQELEQLKSNFQYEWLEFKLLPGTSVQALSPRN